MLRRLVSFLPLLFVLVAACGRSPPPEPPPPAPSGAGPGLFSEEAAARGLDFTHVSGAYGQKYFPEIMGGGCAFLDYDLDGDQDVLMVNGKYWQPWHRKTGDPRPTPGLYRNDGAGRFQDVTAEAGLALAFYGLGVAVGDVDGDLDPDILLAGISGNLFLRNEGGHFVDATTESGLGGDDNDYNTGAGFFDADGDGDLDLFICNYVLWSKQIDEKLAFTLPSLGRVYGPPGVWEGRHCHFYRNRGDGTFFDDSEKAGMHVTTADGKPAAKALGLALADMDADGDIDVFVGNDTVRNFLFRNKGDGTFEEIGDQAGVARGPSGANTGAMGVDIADFESDGSLSIGVGNYYGEDNSLYVSRKEEAAFADRAPSHGLGVPTRPLITWGFFFFDYDLDGHLDLFQTNGGLEEKGHLLIPPVPFRQPSQLFRSTAVGPGKSRRFTLLDDAQSGDLTKPVVGRGAAFADIDADGDLDILVGQIAGPALLLVNNQSGGAHWLRVKLEGTGLNREAIGAWVEIEAGGRRQRRQVMPTRSYCSQVELPVTFGLGATDRVEALRIRWPDGTRSETRVEGVDRTIHIRKSP
jgi:hypothetical protein